jgi:hypothetical protein
MALTPHERAAADKRIVEIQVVVAEMDAALDDAGNSFDAEMIRRRAALVKERVALAMAIYEP